MATAGALTPYTGGSAVTVSPKTDATQLREMIGVTKTTLETIGQQFRILQEQQAKIANVGPTMENAASQIDGLRRQIRRQDRKQQARMHEVKELIRQQLKEQATRQLQSHIQEEIRREIVAQVKEQVDLQIREHLPVTLDEQARESKGQLVEVKHALMNSESRRANSNLRTDNLTDQLAVVLKPDGTRSDVYPHNLHSLFAYSDEMLTVLLRDHELSVNEEREKNLNRFMAHIGVGFRLVPIPGMPGTNEAKDDSSVSPTQESTTSRRWE
ncbi:hypothetical protein BDY19DRAFT_992181 [Irpex rosettiformis]|uniref:Uncharacterized protein n=1 Tax=Irpex rosettiformis TaxID=378272 RepID=A0ACB8U962_9APHY|nr:hypothetical protein BDY19DRAFT_992181 [Irpex rosettiformis]